MYKNTLINTMTINTQAIYAKFIEAVHLLISLLLNSSILFYILELVIMLVDLMFCDNYLFPCYFALHFPT